MNERTNERPHRDDLQHLWPADEAVAIQVIHGEGPLELLLQPSPRGHREGAEELPEVDRAVTICVERAENVLRELGREGDGDGRVIIWAHRLG